MLGDYDCAPDVVAYPRSEAEISAVMDWAGGRQRLADAVRRRLERLRRRRAARRRRSLQGRRHARSAPSRQGGRGGSGLARRTDRRRRLWSVAGEPAQAARRHLAAFPAEFRIFDARRLDRDPLGRPFRQPLHAYRRFRRKPARRDAARHPGNAPPAGLGRRTEPRPHVDRLGRNARRDLARLDAVAAASEIPRRRVGSLPDVLRRGARRARHRAGRALSIELPHPRPAGGLQHRRRRRQRRHHGARLRIRRSSAGRLDGARARMLRRSWRHAGGREAGDAHLRRRGGHLAQRLHPHALCARVSDARGPHQRHVRDRHHLGPVRELPRQGARRQPSARSWRRPASRARSPAASPMSIRTAPRPISPSTRSAVTARCSSSGRRSRTRPATR